MARETKQAKLLRELRETITAEMGEACEIDETPGNSPLPFPFPPRIAEIPK